MIAVPITTALTPYPDHRLYVALGSNLKLGSTVWSTELSFFHWEGEGARAGRLRESELGPRRHDLLRAPKKPSVK